MTMDERKEFEAWAKARGLDLAMEYYHDSRCDEYLFSDSRFAWEVWTVRAALERAK